MHAADAARCKHFYARKACNEHRCGNRRCAVRTLCHDIRNIAAADFCNIPSFPAEILYLFLGKARAKLTSDDRNRCGNRAVRTCQTFARKSRFDVLRIRHSVRNNRAFKRNNGSSQRKCLANFIRKFNVVIHFYDHDFRFGESLLSFLCILQPAAAGFVVKSLSESCPRFGFKV